MIDENIVFQILHFLIYSDKFIRIADGIPKQTDKRINGLYRPFSVILIDQPLDACQRVINIMRIDLHLQCLNL